VFLGQSGRFAFGVAVERTAPSTMTASLTIRGLDKRFPGGVAGLQAFGLDVVPGEVVAVLGQAAAGKTTLLRLIAGLEQPTAGIIRIDGEDMARRPAGRRPVSLVFQTQALFPHLTAAANVGYGTGRRGLLGRRDPEADEVARGALALVGLEGMADRRPGDLDDAQRRRLALARALARRPRILLLDNPLAGLVGHDQAELLGLIVAVQRATGLTVLVATDDPDAALAIADRAVVLDAGRTRQVGTPADLMERPADRHVARYVARFNLLDAGALGIHGRDTTVGIAPDRVRAMPHQPAPPAIGLAVRARRPVYRAGVRHLLAETLEGAPFLLACPDPCPREGDVLWAAWDESDMVRLRG
jgi:ABC-type Fe3+/spermidine/putrescine transport system ATPase subunit